MSDGPKKPGVMFWATVVVIGALVMYPLSFGPACWMISRSGVNQHEYLDSIYWPLGHVMYESWPIVAPALARFAEAGMPAGHRLFLQSHAGREDGCLVLIGHWVYPAFVGLAVFPASHRTE